MVDVFESEESAAEAVDAAERALADGRCVVFPTDTVYGLGARPDIPGATEAVFEIKRRPRDLTVPVLVGGTADAEAVATLDERAVLLARRFWPGGLTLVLPRTRASAAWNLGAESATVGVRVPAEGIAVALLSRTGPLAVTSANISGQPTPSTCEEVRAVLGERVEVYICGGPSNHAVPSTVVDLTAEEARILRAGAIPPGEVFLALSGS